MKTPFDYAYGGHAFTPTENKGVTRVFSSGEKGAAHRNDGAVSRTLTSNVMRGGECAKNVRQRTAARLNYISEHGYIMLTTPTHPPVFIAVLSVFAKCISCTYVHIRLKYCASVFYIKVIVFSYPPPPAPFE